MTQEDKKPNEEQESYGLVVQSKCFSNHLSLLEYNSYKMREVIDKFVRAYGHEKCVHTTLLAEAYEDAKAILAATPEPIGNGAKMRDALLAVRKLDFYKEEDCYDFDRIIDDALATPPRNCDVGTAEEQLKRFKDFCRIISKDETCDGCPLLPQCSTLEHCTLAWSQMPYSKGENNENK